MSASSVPDVSKSNHREHEALRFEIENLRAALDSLAAHSDAIANLRALREVAEHLHALLADIPSHMVHEERTVLSAMVSLGPEEARFAELMRRQHQMLKATLEHFFQMLNEVHDSSDLRAGLRNLQDYGKDFTKLLLHHMETEERHIQLLFQRNVAARA